MKNQIKRHLRSFLVTFVATFLILMYPAIATGEWTYAAFMSAVFAAVRGSLKLAYEVAIIPFANYLISLFSNKDDKTNS